MDEAEHRDRDTERDQQGDRDRPLAELDVVLLGLDVRAAHEPARPDDERLVQDDQPPNEGPLAHRRGMDTRVQLLGRSHDPPIRMAQGDRDRVATAHEDALHEGLSSVGEGRRAAAGRAVRRQRRRIR